MEKEDKDWVRRFLTSYLITSAILVPIMIVIRVGGRSKKLDP